MKFSLAQISEQLYFFLSDHAQSISSISGRFYTGADHLTIAIKPRSGKPCGDLSWTLDVEVA